MEGLSNREQAILLFISSLLIAVAGISVPWESPYLTIGLAIAGAVGFAIKEFLGGKPKT